MAVRFLQRYGLALLLGASLLGNAYWGFEFHRLADRFETICCEPYGDLGCVTVEEYVCEDEETWSKSLIECSGQSEAAQEFMEYWERSDAERAACNYSRERCERMLDLCVDACGNDGP